MIILSDRNTDTGEDAFWTVHELGHGLHWAQTDGNFSEEEGLSEGLSDYWGQSNGRDCSISTSWDEWDAQYHKTFLWGGMPAVESIQRTTNFTAQYPEPQQNDHAMGQYISTALMRIRSDLGAHKTDQLVISSMTMLSELPSPRSSLKDAAELIYDEAVILGFSNNELCIVYKHLDDSFNIDNTPPSGGNGDVYMKDTPCDIGEEINPDDGRSG